MMWRLKRAFLRTGALRLHRAALHAVHRHVGGFAGHGLDQLEGEAEAQLIDIGGLGEEAVSISVLLMTTGSSTRLPILSAAAMRPGV